MKINPLLIKQVKDVYGKEFENVSFDKNVQTLLKKINSSYNNLEYQSNQNNILFEEEENIVFTIGMTAGVLRANKKFYETFGFKNLADFKKNYNCICELFIEDEGYLKETTVKVHWTDPITKEPELKHKALIKNFKGDRRVYAVLLKEVVLEDSKLKICTFTDITELEEALKASRKSEEIKSMFMANMSHEIRTPMNGIMGFTKLLLASETTDEQEDFLKLIENSTATLSKMIDDILDFSEIEKRTMKLELNPVNIFKDLDLTFASFKSAFQEKNIVYSANVDPSISKGLIFDKSMVLQVLNNLVSNAIKFTGESGEVSVGITKLESTNSHELLLFSVSDTGIGIKESDQDRIFNSFTQADSSLNKEFSGTGLGLSISKSICERMYSELRVKSILGEGSSFCFELCLKKS